MTKRLTLLLSAALIIGVLVGVLIIVFRSPSGKTPPPLPPLTTAGSLPVQKPKPKAPKLPPYPVFAGEVKVLAPPSPLIYHTAHPDFGPVEALVTSKRVLAFEQLSGKKLAWASFADNWFTGIRFPASHAEAIWAAGVVPMIRVMPRVNFNNGCGGPYSLRALLSKRFDKQLDRYAASVAATHIPVMIDFLPEPNGNWFPWSGVCNGGASGVTLYQAVWKKFEGIFRQEHALNVTWVYHPDTLDLPHDSWNTINAYYPGDRYIDWVGVSNYGSQRPTNYWSSLSQTFPTAYAGLEAATPHKPVALLETGVVDGVPGHSKAQWIADAFATLNRRDFPRLAAVGWWQSNFVIDHVWSLVRIDSSPSSLAAYRKAIAQPRFLDHPLLSAKPLSQAAALKLLQSGLH
jgi:hypothetical protein